MDPKIWGPHAWFFMHSITLVYPDEPTDNDKNNIKQFFNYLGKVIPCMKCRGNFEDHLKKLPLDDTVLSSRNNLVKWLFKFHNEVNITTGKPKIDYITFMRNFIEASKKEENENMFSDKFNLFIILFMLLILIILIIVFMRIAR